MKYYFNIKNLNFSYNNDIYNLYDLNLKIELGKRYLLAGNNHSGKTTLLKLLSGDIISNQNIYTSIKKDDVLYLKNLKDKFINNKNIKIKNIYENIDKKFTEDKEELLKIFKINKEDYVDNLSIKKKNLINIILFLLNDYKVICMENIISKLEKIDYEKLIDFLFIKSQTKKKTILMVEESYYYIDKWATDLIFLSGGQIKYNKKINKISIFCNNLSEFIDNKKKVYKNSISGSYIKISKKRKIYECNEKSENDKSGKDKYGKDKSGKIKL